MKRLLSCVLLLFALAACQQQSDDPVLELPATATLQPIVSSTARQTSTPVLTRTPLPTFTYTPTLTLIPPSPTNTFTPTLTPTVAGIIQSAAARVNVREAPDQNARQLTSLVPGTGVQVIGQSADGDWINIRLEDGMEGWIFNALIFIPASPTPFPTLTPSPNLTALFLGTPLPTAFIGGGTITPTPPNQVRTGTPEIANAANSPVPTSNLIDGVPVIDNNSIYQTATALAGGLSAPIRPTQSGTADRAITPDATTGAGTPTQAPLLPSPTVDIRTVNGKDVFAYCDDPRFGIPAPTNVRAGDYIDVWWAWFAKTEQQAQDHVDAVTIDLRVNGEVITDVNSYVRQVTPAGGSSYSVYWYVPFGPVQSGRYEITYVATWERAIFDGSDNFGPSTENPFDQQTCTFTVP